ncbi:MAG: IS66 family insertion sequence element accessory protein TnpA [Phocaeicola sp.]
MVYWNLAYFKHLYEEYITSGTSIRGFCHSKGINENRFYYWIHKLKLNAVPSINTSKSFIPLTSQEVSCLTGVAIKEKEDRALSVKQQNIKLLYPNGVVLQLEAGCEIEMLKQLITLTS